MHRVGDAIQPSHPLSSPSPPAPQSLPASVFSNESTLHMRWPKYWSFSFSISPSKEHPGLISFRMDWLGLLAVQGTLKSLFQHHSSKASILQCSAFFTVQLLFSHRQQLFHFLYVQLYQIHIALPIMKSLQCLGVGLFGFILFLILCSSCT